MSLAKYAAPLIERLANSFGANRSSPGLLLLVVQPFFRGGATVLRLELSAGAAPTETSATDEEPWEIPFSEFQAEQPDLGVPLRHVPALRVPDELCSSVAYRLMLKEAPPDKPLWLKLAAPYGLLGTVPWEAALGAAL